MKKYLSFFRMRFNSVVQYRMAAVSAVTTQFVWGLMECFAYKTILGSNSASFPMEYPAIVSYIWLKEAFYTLFNTWATDNDIFGMIMDGGIAYEMCRPVSIYGMWFSRNAGGRVAQAFIRCIPILILAMLVPSPFRIGAPCSLSALVLFILTTFLGLCVTVSFCMVVYMLCFFTISPQGWRMLLTGAVEFLAGNILPIPFMPEPYRTIIELLPFASMQNVPFRIYSGDLSGENMIRAILLQLIWAVILYILGNTLYKKAERRVVVQGG